MNNKHIDVLDDLIEDYTYGVEHNHNSKTDMKNCEFCMKNIIGFRKSLMTVLLMKMQHQSKGR